MKLDRKKPRKLVILKSRPALNFLHLLPIIFLFNCNILLQTIVVNRAQ